MLHPKQNRIDYGSQLVPPPEYQLDYAVGTTYSLDLEALMILPVALFYAQPLDGDPSRLRFDMLDAITKASEKISIYCQKGQIKVPQKFHHLIAYWEEGNSNEIQMDTFNQSFHPKVWIIRYVHEFHKPIYKVIVTSRNLTFARDWDVAFSTEGIVQEETIKANESLLKFLTYLDDKGSKKIPPNFYSELLKVKFDKDLGKFNKLRFHPIGIVDPVSNKPSTNPILKNKTIDELLVVSPFVDNSTLNSLAAISGRKRYLLSRKEELDKINQSELLKYNNYQFSKIIEQSELDDSLQETTADASMQSLHAKLFITQSAEIVTWYLGSANCTNPAQSRNIEFMVELISDAIPAIRPRDIFNQLTNPDKAEGVALFEPYNLTNKTNHVSDICMDQQIRKIKYDLCSLEVSGEVKQIAGATAYDLEIIIDANSLTLPSGYSVRFKPITEEQKKAIEVVPGALNRITEYKGFAETRLSPFVEFEIWFEDRQYCNFLRTMEIELPASRLNKIFSSIINSRDKFLKYLSFLLTGEEISLIDVEELPGKTKSEDKEKRGLFDQLPIYEKLLIAASRYPEKLISVDKLMQRLKEETCEGDEVIITKEFEDFWEVFRNYKQMDSYAG